MIPSVQTDVNPDMQKHNSHTGSHSHVLNPQKLTMFSETSGPALPLLPLSKPWRLAGSVLSMTSLFPGWIFLCFAPGGWQEGAGFGNHRALPSPKLITAVKAISSFFPPLIDLLVAYKCLFPFLLMKEASDMTFSDLHSRPHLWQYNKKSIQSSFLRQSIIALAFTSQPFIKMSPCE